MMTSIADMADIDLADHAAAGDEDAFEEIVRRYFNFILKRIRVQGVPQADVDDVVNETLLLLWRGLSKLADDMRTWNRSTLSLGVAWTARTAIYRFRGRQGSVQDPAIKNRIPGFWRIPKAERLGEYQVECNETDDQTDARDAAEFLLSHVSEEDRSIVMRRMAGAELKAIEKADGAGKAHARRRIDAAIADMQHVARSPHGPLGIMVLPSGNIRRKGHAGETFARPGSDNLTMILSAIGDADSRDDVAEWSASKLAQRKFKANRCLQAIGLEMLYGATGFRDLSDGTVCVTPCIDPAPPAGRRVIHSTLHFGLIIR